MNKAGIKFSKVKKILMKDKVFKEEYEKLKLSEELLTVEKDGLTGNESYSLEELDKHLEGVTKEVEHRKDSPA